MDAVKYIKEKRRLCGDRACNEFCPIWEYCDTANEELGHEEELVSIVEEWSRENPLVTNGDKIWEMIPSDLRSTTIKQADSEAFDMNMITAKDYIELRIVKEWWDAEYKEENND